MGPLRERFLLIARAADLLTNSQSITAAQASVGNAAACPMTGTIFTPADTMRHGAASTPHPPSNMGRAITTISALNLEFMYGLS